LVLLVALLAAPGFAKKPTPAAATQPPIEEPADDPPPPDEPDPFVDPETLPDEAPAAAPRPGYHRDGGRQSISEAFLEGFNEGLRKEEARQGRPVGADELSGDEAAAVGLVSICCCLFVFLGIVGLVVWLVVRSKKASQASAAPSPAGPGPMPAQPPAGGTHLSVVAVAFDARARGAVEGALRSAGASTSPMNAEARATLVRTLCRALLDSSGNWRAFGYGDKTDFADDAAAEQSFRAAWSDFRGRCLGAGEAGGELCVAVLVLCSRGAVLGTSKLDDPAQARALLQHRMGIATEALLAADCFFAPPDASTALSPGDAYRRFPEMQPLGPG
jgi:Protein of unknown function (DUF1517)